MLSLYNVSFRLGTPSRAPPLEEIVDVAREWLVRAGSIPREELVDLAEGTAAGSPPVHVQSIRTESDGCDFFGMKLFQIEEETELAWNTTLTIGHSDVGVRVDIRLENGSRGSQIAPTPAGFMRPDLVFDLISRFGAYEDYPLSLAPRVLAPEDTPDFLNRMSDDTRVLPLLLISCRKGADEPLKTVDPSLIASSLAGLAHVYIAQGRSTARKLEKLRGKRLNCSDGAVGIYWPLSGNGNARLRHTLLTPQELRRKGSAQEIFYRLAAPSCNRTVSLGLSYEEILRRQIRYHIEEIAAQQTRHVKRHKEIAELLGLYESDNSTLRRENDDLKGDNVVLVQKLLALEARVCAHESTIAALKIQNAQLRAGAEVADEGGEPTSVVEALEAFDKLYPPKTRGVIIHGRAMRGAKECRFSRPQQVLHGLEWLETTYRAARRGELSGSLEVMCKQATGLDYKSGTSSVTMGKHFEAYYLDVDGVKQPLREHMGIGNSYEGCDTLRIAFYYDKRAEKVHVGFIGRHQP